MRDRPLEDSLLVDGLGDLVIGSSARASGLTGMGEVGIFCVVCTVGRFLRPLREEGLDDTRGDL